MKNGNNDDFWPQAKHQSSDIVKVICQEMKASFIEQKIDFKPIEMVRELKSLPQDDSLSVTVDYVPVCDVVFSLTKHKEFSAESAAGGFQLQMLKSRGEKK
jgi:hypothetical protein